MSNNIFFKLSLKVLLMIFVFSLSACVEDEVLINQEILDKQAQNNNEIANQFYQKNNPSNQQVFSVSDITGHWAKVEIDYLLANNYASGYPDGTFRPNNFLTRAEFASLIARVFDPAPIRPAIEFSDVPTTNWAHDAIQKAYRGGFLSGFPGGTFQPTANLTRTQSLVAISNGMNLTGGDTNRLSSYYNDASQIQTWAKTPIANATINNLIANYPNKRNFRANENATRAEVSVILYRALVKQNKATDYKNPYLITYAKMPLIVMYHEVLANPIYSSDVSTSNFTAQINFFKSEGYRTLSLDEFYEVVTNHAVVPEKSVLITFDDGYIGNYNNAIPVLQQNNFKAAFFVHTNFVGVSAGSHPKMSWNQLRTVDANPLFEVESHTVTHGNLAQMTATQIQSELANSKAAIETQLNKTCEYITYPFGSYNEEVGKQAPQYYKIGFAVSFLGYKNAPEAYSIPRIGIGKDLTSLALFRQRIGR